MKKLIPRKKQLVITQLVKKVYFFLAILIALLIGIKSIEYLSPDFSRGYLSDKEGIFESHFKYFLYAHMIAAPMAFFLGIFQFSFTKSSVHRYIGILYVLLIVLFAAPSAFGMAFYAIGGLWSIINFTLMAVLWILFTVLAYTFIHQKNVKKHQQFMIRSFILTNSAILIRIFAFINNHYEITDLTTGYVIISWLSWLPWLLIYEMKLRWINPHK